MFLLGHAGLTVGLVEALRRRVPWMGAVDYRVVVVGALLPDLIDKPLGHLILDMGTGRLWGHTLLACLLAWTAWGALARRGTTLAPGALVAGALAVGITSHLAFDLLWDAPRVLLWPLLGWGMPHGDHSGFADWWDALLHSPFVQVTEVAGLLAGLWVLSRVHARGELARYLLPRPVHSGRVVTLTPAVHQRELEEPPQQR